MADDEDGTSPPGGTVMDSPGYLNRLADSLDGEAEGTEGTMERPDPSPQRPNNLGFSRNHQPSPSAESIAAAASAAADALGDNTPAPVMPPARAAKRKSPPGTTTARKKKTKKAQTKLKIGGRVWSTRKSLYLSGLLNSNQQAAIQQFPQNYRLYGTVKIGKGTQGHNVEYDILPAGHKICKGVLRNRIVTLKEGEEEIEMPDSVEAMAEIEVEEEKKKKKSFYEQAFEDFLTLETEEIVTATLFEMKIREEETIEWEILPDDKHISADEDQMKWPDELYTKKDINFDEEPLGQIFFCDFFPCVEGHAKLLDEFHSDPRSPFYRTYTEEKIKFHQEDDDDPYWIVKQCYLLLIAAVTEAETGVDNLWKRGESGGRHRHPDFGMYVPKNYFKAFQTGCALMFADKKWWYTDRRDRDWDIFTPVLESFNEKRRALFHCLLLMLDKSMSAWKPKTSKTGGLPNITNEPRKPVDLGTQLQNGVEYFSGILVHQDALMGPEKQRQKKHFYSNAQELTKETTSLPRNDDMSAHTAEVLRQAEGAAVKEGGWVGGDAWFGSVMTAVEARHGSHPAGHWVVMRTIIAGVPLIAMAYAWSQKGVSYFISTCGKTTPSPIKYEAKFEDEWGNTNFREIPRPDILHILYEYLPLIDEHNKSRQSLLALEKRWQTRIPWFQLVTTIVGMTVVDMYRLYRHNQIKVMEAETEEVDNLRIIRFTDLLCGNLRTWTYQHRRRMQRERPVLERIRDEEGNTTAEPTQWQSDNRNASVGNPIAMNCFICRRYLTEKGTTTYRKTSYWCKDCHMPLCDKDRAGNDGGRELNCVDEHCCAEDPDFNCSGRITKNKSVPKHKQVSL